MQYRWTFYTRHARHDAYVTERTLTREQAIAQADAICRLFGYPVVAYSEHDTEAETLLVDCEEAAQAA